MQYILSQEEYDAIINNRTRKTKDETRKLQEFCTMVANKLPVKTDHREHEAAWGCCLTVSDWYCDECPAQEICPSTHKHWSK